MILKIMTPAKVVFEGEVEDVYLPGVKGEFGVLPEHAEMMSELSSGICRFTRKGGAVEKLALSTGVCHVADNEIVVLTGSADKKEEIDPSKAKAALIEIEHKLVVSELTDKERVTLEGQRALEQSRLELLS